MRRESVYGCESGTRGQREKVNQVHVEATKAPSTAATSVQNVAAPTPAEAAPLFEPVRHGDEADPPPSSVPTMTPKPDEKRDDQKVTSFMARACLVHTADRRSRGVSGASRGGDSTEALGRATGTRAWRRRRTERDSEPSPTPEARLDIGRRDRIEPLREPQRVKAPAAKQRVDRVGLGRRRARDEAGEGSVAERDGVLEGLCECAADEVRQAKDGTVALPPDPRALHARVRKSCQSRGAG